MNSQMSIPLLVLQWPATLEEHPSEEVSAVEEGETWMTPLVQYLEADILPEDRNEARKIKKQAARYYISQEKLYRRSFSGPYLRCVTPREATRILVEQHEGARGSQSSCRILVLRAKKACYFWPKMAAYAKRHLTSVRGTLQFQASPREPHVHKLTMALRKMGHGYSREIPYGAGAEGLPSDSH